MYPQKCLHSLFIALIILFCSVFIPYASQNTSKAATQKDSISAISKSKPDKTPVATENKNSALPTDTVQKTKKNQSLTDSVFYNVEGGYIDYDVEKKTMHLIGNATIKYQDIILNADSIIYLMEDGLLTATGKPQLIEKQDTTIGESMVYNIKTKRGRVKYASAHMNDAFFNGNKIIKTETNDLYIDQGDYTTCAYVDTPDYFFYGKNIKIIPEKEIVCRPVVLALGRSPVAYLPFFIFPLERNRRSGLLTPIWGGRPESGGYLDNLGYYWAINDYLDFMGSARISEFRDFVFNASSQYKLKYVLDGSISGRYGRMGEGSSKSDDYSIDYSNNWNITPDQSFTLAGRGSLVGKSFYKTYSLDAKELLDQSINANLSLSKRFTSINASASATWSKTQNLSTNAVSEDLPSLSFSLPSRALFPFTSKENLAPGEIDEPNWYNKFTYSYSANALRQSKSTSGDTGKFIASSGLTQQLNISSPQTFLKNITVTPNFNARHSFLDSYTDTVAKDTSFFVDTTFDTLSRAQLEKLPVDTSLFIADTFYTPNLLTGINDTTFKHRKTLTSRKVPNFPLNKKWAQDYSWNAGVNVNTNLYGVFPIHILNFVGLRHVLTPSIGYTFTPKHMENIDKRFSGVVQVEPARRKQSQSVNIGLSNEFQGKTIDKPAVEGEKPVEKKFQILSGGISTAYDFEAENHKWSDLSLTANTSYNIVRVTYGSAFFMYDESNKQIVPLLRNYNVTLSTNTLNASGVLWEGDKIAHDSLQPKNDLHYLNAGPQKWNVSLSPSYTFSQTRNKPTDLFVTTKQYSLSTSASLNMTRAWSIAWSSTYNFATNQLVNNDFRFHFEQDCWELRFDWRPGGAGAYNPGYYFLVSIKKIPEIKWENRQ